MRAGKSIRRVREPFRTGLFRNVRAAFVSASDIENDGPDTIFPGF